MREGSETTCPETPDGPARPSELEDGAGSRRMMPGAWRILRARWWLVVLCVAAALSSAAAYLRTATRVYTSSALVLVEQTTPSVALDDLNQTTRFDNYLYTQAELLKTTPIVREVVKQPGVKDCRTLRGAADPVSAIQGLLECSVGKKNDLISVALSSPYPDEAARLLNHVIRAYVDYHSRNTRDTASEILRILKDARETGNAELSGAMAKVLEFRRKNGVLFLDNAQGNPITQRLAMLSDELTRAELTRIQTKVSYESILAVRKDPARVRELFRSLEPNAAASAQERSALAEILGSAEVRYAGLIQKYAPSHPQVLEAAAECKAAREQLQRHDEQQVDAIVAVVEQQHRAAEGKVAELETAIGKQRELAMDFNAKAVEYAMLESDLKRKERLGEILDGRIKEIDIRGDAGGLNIAVLEEAKVPRRPSWPDAPRVLALALLLGLALGLGLALLFEWLDDRIRGPADLPHGLGLRFLGEVPFLRNARDSLGKPLDEEGTLPLDRYDEIRSLLAPSTRGDTGTTILFTSAADGEGKTSTVGGLAVSMARTGARTLVVDGDFMAPRQHERFGTAQAPGLSELLAGEATLHQVIAPTATPQVHLLPSGAAPARIAEAIRTGTCTALFDLLALAYDYILVDSPAALASPDARALAAACDQTVVVLRSNQSTSRASLRTRQVLRNVGASLGGVILNATRRRR